MTSPVIVLLLVKETAVEASMLPVNLISLVSPVAAETAEIKILAAFASFKSLTASSYIAVTANTSLCVHVVLSASKSP